MRRHPIVPFRNPPELDGISLENAEDILIQALKICPGVPLIIHPQNIIDTDKLYKGRPVMRERQKVKIEEIGDTL